MNASDLTKQVEAYFGAVDRADLAGILKTMTPDVTMHYVSAGERYSGRDTGVKAYFTKRNAGVEKSWHGDFWHIADVPAGRVATRFGVRRTDKGQPERLGDNVNTFEFEGTLIKRICVWRGQA
jgi:hypothetical protein